MTAHDHGSTGIAGVAFYDATQFPAEYRQHVLRRQRGDERRPTRRAAVARVVAVDRGTAGRFRVVRRPVVPAGRYQAGSRRALYIADFYNCIIGHYEVDLKHPRRDRHRGRIWRVVWKGDAANPAAPALLPNFTSFTTSQLVERLGDENLAVRRQATRELQTRGDAADIEAARKLPVDSFGAASGLARERSRPFHGTRRARTERPVVTAHARAVAGGSGGIAEVGRGDRRVGADQLREEDPFVRRFAATAMARRHDGSESRR